MYKCCVSVLQDVLKNEDSPLDDMFITSLVQDLYKVRACFLRLFDRATLFSKMIHKAFHKADKSLLHLGDLKQAMSIRSA
jgi:hypothetical protein